MSRKLTLEIFEAVLAVDS